MNHREKKKLSATKKKQTHCPNWSLHVSERSKNTPSKLQPVTLQNHGAMAEFHLLQRGSHLKCNGGVPTPAAGNPFTTTGGEDNKPSAKQNSQHFCRQSPRAPEDHYCQMFSTSTLSLPWSALKRDSPRLRGERAFHCPRWCIASNVSKKYFGFGSVMKFACPLETTVTRWPDFVGCTGLGVEVGTSLGVDAGAGLCGEWTMGVTGAQGATNVAPSVCALRICGRVGISTALGELLMGCILGPPPKSEAAGLLALGACVIPAGVCARAMSPGDAAYMVGVRGVACLGAAGRPIDVADAILAN